MRHLKHILGGDVRQFGMLGALIALILFFHVLTGGKTLTPGNAINIISGNSYVLVLAIGMVLVIIAGHIDLSVGSVAAAVGIVVAMSIQAGAPWWLGILIGLAAGPAGGLRRDTGVHRDSRRHAHLPRTQPVHR